MNNKPYFGLWMLLAVALAVFVGVSLISPVKIFGVELQKATFVDALTASAQVPTAHKTAPSTVKKPRKHQRAALDTASKTILFIGDSMLEGLSPRLASYARLNGHKLYTVIWYSSTTEVWGSSDKLKHYVNKYHPDYVFVCLGANELFVRDIITKRSRYVDNMLSQIGNIPYVWIGPPNWKKDTGINRLIASKAKPGCFFLSDGMKFDRSKDGAHPTRKSSALWMDSVARWVVLHSAHPIRLKTPMPGNAKANRVEVLQPKR